MVSYVEVFEDKIYDLLGKGLSKRQVAKELGLPKSSLSDYLRGKNLGSCYEVKQEAKVKILTIDIETSPLFGALWSLWQDGIALNQLEKDWHILSFAAHWYGSPDNEVIYMDQSSQNDIEDDFEICMVLQNLIAKADCVLVQNGRRFDMKKINARCIMNGLPPCRPVRIIDTLEIAKREFSFTSNKLEYMTEKLCKKYKKLKHKKFPGYELWREVLARNPEAWAEMKEYNIHDVLSLEELFDIIKPYSTKHPNVALMHKTNKPSCRVCGSTNLSEDGVWHTSLSQYDLYRCNDCGAYSRGRKTNTTKEQRANVTMATIS